MAPCLRERRADHDLGGRDDFRAADQIRIHGNFQLRHRGGVGVVARVFVRGLSTRLWVLVWTLAALRESAQLLSPQRTSTPGEQKNDVQPSNSSKR